MNGKMHWKSGMKINLRQKEHDLHLQYMANTITYEELTLQRDALRERYQERSNFKTKYIQKIASLIFIFLIVFLPYKSISDGFHYVNVQAAKWPNVVNAKIIGKPIYEDGSIYSNATFILKGKSLTRVINEGPVPPAYTDGTIEQIAVSNSGVVYNNNDAYLPTDNYPWWYAVGAVLGIVLAIGIGLGSAYFMSFCAGLMFDRKEKKTIIENQKKIELQKIYNNPILVSARKEIIEDTNNYLVSIGMEPLKYEV